ncbi:MAG: hypothetical protein H6797_04235 [Candidatus Nomurabacteria bacterium]|nr:MAG: hypothetical protein H6797_04235 [Candidatus Nomurabacteria bacterium]
MTQNPKKRPPFAWQGWLNVVMIVAASAGIAYAATLPPDASQSYGDRLTVFFGAVALYALAIVVIALTKGAVPRLSRDNRPSTDDEDL